MDEERGNPSGGETVDRSISSRGLFADQISNATSRFVHSGDTTRLLFMGDNFHQGRSDQDIFFDCQSNRVVTPMEGRSASSLCKLDDPVAIREALVRATNATQELLKNFDKSGGWNNPCTVTLEITVRLIDPEKSKTGCPMHGKPVTVQMPLQFNPQGGGRITCCRKKQLSRACDHISESICRSQATSNAQKPSVGKFDSQLSQNSQSRTVASVYMSSECTICPNQCDPDAREVISIFNLPVPEHDRNFDDQMPILEPLPISSDVTIQEADVKDSQLGEPLVDPESIKNEIMSELNTESNTESIDSSELKESAEEMLMPDTQLPSGKKYYLALPQNKEFSNCSPCRFDPSPIMDEDGNVFCPGNCGCCMCPWKRRTFDENRLHTNVKVCRCVQRGTIFTKFDEREVCSQTSYFDFCPCREKAEAKFLELYHNEMWGPTSITRGREIKLSEIKELIVPFRQSE
ncbi:hypothetical protein KR018_009919 [Drosophila ironensis]|nr:hypothetical protein KR018_009919 [Drosophila ironensis]